MSAIEGCTVKVSTLVDGTLRLVVDIEPTSAQSAFRMFGAPGTPVALARLKTKAEQANDAPKGGPLAKLAGQWCHDSRFLEWLCVECEAKVYTPEAAAEHLRKVCGVESRAMLDHDDEAARKFHTLIREPFAAYIKANT